MGCPTCGSALWNGTECGTCGRGKTDQESSASPGMPANASGSGWGIWIAILVVIGLVVRFSGKADKPTSPPPKSTGSAVAAPAPSAQVAIPVAQGDRWLLTMPRGFEYDATLEPAGEVGLYRLRCGALNLQGLYEVRGGRLTLVKPDNLHLAGLAWEIRNNNALLLTEQPNQEQVGSDYRGATLGRQKQAGRAQR